MEIGFDIETQFIHVSGPGPQPKINPDGTPRVWRSPQSNYSVLLVLRKRSTVLRTEHRLTPGQLSELKAKWLTESKNAPLVVLPQPAATSTRGESVEYGSALDAITADPSAVLTLPKITIPAGTVAGERKPRFGRLRAFFVES
jgi:hypothetical protein